MKLQNALQIQSRHQSERRTHRAEVSWLPEHAAARRDQLAELRREHDELRRSMYEAAQVQRKLCGPRHLRRESFEITTEIFPVRHLSGDFISVLELDGDLVFAIGDIAGKGLYAGIWFTHVVSMVRLQIDALGDPASALSAINRDLLRTGLEPPLTSLLLARLNPKSGEIRYCNAGHPPALLLRQDGQVEQLREGGPLLGVVAAASFTNGEFAMQPGDTVLGYSDGITECRNPMGAEFGLERLLATAQISHGCTASSKLFSVLGAVEDFAGSHPREDDMALVVVHRGNE